MAGLLDINQIGTELITELSKSMARALYKKVTHYIKDVQQKEEIQFGVVYEDYLKYAKETHEKIKTLLYRHTAKDIYSFYECVGVNRDGDVIDTSDVNNVLELGNNIIISGTGGIGKSVMMKHFFLNVIHNTRYVPVLVELRGLNEFDEKNVNIVDYIFSVMERLKFKLERPYFEYSLDTGRYVFLLDGFDEVKNEISKQVTSQIFALSEKYPDNHYIISSRPLEEEFMGWNRFKEVHSMPLSKEQALSLIKKIEYEPKIKGEFYKELEKDLYEKYETFASNPLLLTIMLLTFENRASIPSNLNDFFEQAFTTLFHRHDATKGGYKRDIKSNLGYEDFRAVFSYFCFQSFFNSDYKFSEYKVLSYIGRAKEKGIIKTEFNSIDFFHDLTNSVCMLIPEGLEYKFSHRLFQEYFTALYTTQLDDSRQKRFLKSWLQEDDYRTTSNYLDMLYALQPSRFMKNIISPAIRELYELYCKHNKSEIWLINLMYTNIFQAVKEDGQIFYVLSSKEQYYQNMIHRACDIGGMLKKKKEEIAQRSNAVREAFFIRSKDEGNRVIDIVRCDELKNKSNRKEILEGLHGVKENFEFAVNYIESLDKDSLEGKQQFSSMLETL